MRKLILTLLLMSSLLTYSSAKITKINLQNNFGDTSIDLQALLGSEFFSISNSPFDTQITDWTDFFYKGVVQLFTDYELYPDVFLGFEAGFNHLYYWEERYYVPYVSSNYRWRSRDVWTFQVGGIAEYMIDDRFFIQSGISFHNFFTGSGTTIGLMLAGGYIITTKSTDFTIPIQLRYDVIFGDQTPKALNYGIGIQYHFE